MKPSRHRMPRIRGRLLGTAVLLALATSTGLAQDEGDVMQIFQRTERQVKQLNQTTSMLQNQMLATKSAIDRFSAAGTPAQIDAAMRQCFDAFGKTERALENLSRVLRELSDSFRGFNNIQESDAGAAQLESLREGMQNAVNSLSSFAAAGGAEGELARASIQEMGLIQAQLERQNALREQADVHKANAEGGATNLDKLSEILARLSVTADIVEIKNNVNREVVFTMALNNAPNVERKDALTRIIGEFGTPSDVVDRITALSEAMTDQTATIIRSLYQGGAGFLAPDAFTAEAIDTALNELNRAQEVSCEQCTDGIDNDLDGRIDAEQGTSCKNFVDFDPYCTVSNTDL